MALRTSSARSGPGPCTSSPWSAPSSAPRRREARASATAPRPVDAERVGVAGGRIAEVRLHGAAALDHDRDRLARARQPSRRSAVAAVGSNTAIKVTTRLSIIARPAARREAAAVLLPSRCRRQRVGARWTPADAVDTGRGIVDRLGTHRARRHRVNTSNFFALTACSLVEPGRSIPSYRALRAPLWRVRHVGGLSQRSGLLTHHNRGGER
jgi:hypothetical protein